MFGTLQPSRCGPLPVVQAHRRLYCGTCQSLGAHFGLTRRALLSHDAVFMATLVEATQSEAAAPSRCRCPMNPLVFRETLAPDSTAMRYAAAMQMLLADQWLADRGADGPGTARVLRSLFSEGPARRAGLQLSRLGANLDVLEGFPARQLAVERSGAGPEVAACPTAAVLATAFETTALLPGAAAAFEVSAVREQLAAFGAAVGTAIYLLDALEDLDADARRGAFNPCLVDGGPSRTRTRAAMLGLDAALATMARAVEELPWVRHSLLLRAVVRRFSGRCRAAEASARRVIARTPAAPQGRWARMATAASAAWAWGVSFTAQAAPSDVGPESPPDLGTSPDVGGPEPVEDLVETDGRCTACDGCARPCTSSCDECFTGCGTWLGDCGTACGRCGECPDACGDCLTPCSEGGACCNDCGQSCGDCGRCCEGGGGCGDGCQVCGRECGQCGQGCTACGEGCQGCGQGCEGCGQGCQGCQGC
ncbi:MAG: DUF5685 family protein [Myxococcota bacterium]